MCVCICFRYRYRYMFAPPSGGYEPRRSSRISRGEL